MTENSSTNVTEFSPKELPELPIWWKRLFGILIDLIVIYLMMSIETIINGTKYLDNLFVVTIFVYFFISETIFQTTIGKSIFGLKVYNAKTGKKPKIWQLWIRTAMRYFPLDFVSYFLKRPRGMKDEIAKTVVTKKTAYNNV